MKMGIANVRLSTPFVGTTVRAGMLAAALHLGCGGQTGRTPVDIKPAGDPNKEFCMDAGSRVVARIAAESGYSCVGGGIVVFRLMGEKQGNDTYYSLNKDGALLNKINIAEEKARADYLSGCISSNGINVYYGFEYLNTVIPCKGGEAGYFTVVSVATPKVKPE